MTTTVSRDSRLQRLIDRDGYAVVDLISRAECEQLLEFWRTVPADLAAMPFSNTSMSHDLDYRRSVHHRVLETLGPPIHELLDGYRTCLCSFNVKRPMDRRGIVEWHQDWSFVDDAHHDSIGIWCPLIDVDLHSGCLRVVPGSHRLNKRPRPFGSIFPYSDLVDCIERLYARAIPMSAGQALVYRQTLFHSSPPNDSSNVRVAAGALAIPVDSPLLFVAPEEGLCGRVVVRRVPDDFYVDYLYGSTPLRGEEIGTFEADFEALSEERLRSILGGDNAGARR